MVSNIGARLSSLKPITGFGIHRHYNKPSVGRGVVRNVAANTVRYIGNALVNKIANSIRGSGFKLTGMGKKRKTRKVAGCGVQRKPRKHLKGIRKSRIIIIKKFSFNIEYLEVLYIKINKNYYLELFK